jgi:DNA-binding transcriptional LysR family regulator
METNPALLDVKLLRLIDQLHRTRSVTRAAEALGQGQPTVSVWLAQLRRQLGDPLFVRTGEGMLPTPRADAMIHTVREVLEGLERLSALSHDFDAGSAQRHFHISITDASHVTLLPRILRRVRTAAPGVVLHARRIDAQLASSLQSGDADLAIGYLPWLDAGFHQLPLFQQDWICLASADHPRLGPPEAVLDVETYAAESHIGVVSGTGYQLMEESFARVGVKRRVALELPGFLGLPAILSGSDLVATLPRQIGETIAADAGLRRMPCPVAIPHFAVKLYWHARFHQDSAHRWIRSLCADELGEPAGSPPPGVAAVRRASRASGDARKKPRPP